MQKKYLKVLTGFFFSKLFPTVVVSTVAISAFSVSAFAAEAVTSSATGNLFKMLIGLAIVLLVLALISWFMKKFMPIGANQASVIRVIGGANVGSREKVVVLEVANRWLVVGVAAGQVTSLANLEPGAVTLQTTQNTEPFNLNTATAQGFAKWLKASSAKFADKNKADKEQKNA